MKSPLVMLCVLSVLMTGCATAIHGTKKKINIETDPPGATATLGDQTITTPGLIKVKRDQWDHFLVVSKPGYKGEVFILEREVSPLLFLNIILYYGASTGIRMDRRTGGAWTVNPGKLFVELEKIDDEEPSDDMEIAVGKAEASETKPAEE